MSTQQPVNVKELSLPQLKAVAFDLQRIVNHWNSQYQAVITELTERETAEAEAKAAAPTPTEQAVNSLEEVKKKIKKMPA